VSHIILVRHGQASFLEQDYDKLCANGETQAQLLGEYWSSRGVVFGGVYSGPRVRQRETARTVSEAYRTAGVDFPETVVMSDFDEYQAEAVLRECLPQLLQANAEINELHRAYQESSESGESAQSGAQCRDGDRVDVARAHLFDERHKPGLNVFESAFAAPMPLGREIDDVLRPGEKACFEHEHLARLNLVALARSFVDLEVFGKCLSKLQSDPAAHNTDTIDGVHEGLRVGGQDVAVLDFYHLALI